jgi:nucleotide-binding universal stress UspA family protein
VTIVVGVDGSAASERALRWAIDEAGHRSSALRLVHGWTYAIGGHVAVSETIQLLADASQSLLDREVALARSIAPDLVIDGVLVQRAPAQSLLEASADADLLVVGTRGHGDLATFFIGSVADACVRHATVPVAVVRPEAVEHEGGAVLVGVDGSETSLEALRWARREAAIRDARVTVVHAWQETYATELSVMAGADADAIEREARETLIHAVEATSSSGGPDPQQSLVRDTAAGALLDASREAALLVVGSRGRGGFTGLLLGSVSRRCVHGAACPLVVVHAPRS